MSHDEYCEDLDEEQLQCLIERAEMRLERYKKEGYVEVWVVADYCNQAWFPIDQRCEAVRKMLELVALNKDDHDMEFSVTKDRMRPSEAAKLFRYKS